MVKINPDDYQPEEERKIDLSLTRHEKMQLLLYLGCILMGLALMAGLFRSYEVVSTQHALMQNLSNLTNSSSVNLSVVGVESWTK